MPLLLPTPSQRGQQSPHSHAWHLPKEVILLLLLPLITGNHTNKSAFLPAPVARILPAACKGSSPLSQQNSRDRGPQEPPGPHSHPQGSSPQPVHPCLSLQVLSLLLPSQPQDGPQTSSRKHTWGKRCVGQAGETQPPYCSQREYTGPFTQLSLQPLQRALLSSIDRN